MTSALRARIGAPRCSIVIALLAVGCGGAAPVAPVTSDAPPPDEPSWTSAVRSLVAEAEHDAQTYDHVASLTDTAGPRLAGSPGDPLAVAWGLARMEALGLSSVHAEPVTVRAWVRGDERVAVISPAPHLLAAAALGGSVGTPAGGLDAEVVRVPSLEALRALSPEQARGRIVFVDQPMERTRDGSGYGTAVVVRGTSASIASGLGAVAVLIRSIGTDATRFPHTGQLRYEGDAPHIPAAALSNPDADVLGRWLESGTPVRVHLELGCHDGGEAQSANVLGEVRGSDHAEEIVILGAHLDSWDLGRGAVDDGAGVAIVLEAARRIATAPVRPRRTVRVVLFANEENGLAGARAYAVAHAEEQVRHVLGLEADFGDGRAWALRTPDLAARTEPGTVSAPWARVGRLLAPLEVVWDAHEPHGGADLGPLREAGMPVADVVQDGTRYFDLHHTANDVLSQVDRSSLDQAMRAVLAVAYAASLDVDGITR